MGLSHNPVIVRNGLTFYYDMNNTVRSWKGAPTTNLIYSVPYALATYAYASGPVSTASVLDGTLTNRTVNRYTITQSVNVARAVIRVSNLVLNTVYTLSFKWKYNGSNTATPSFIVDASKGYPLEGGGVYDNTYAATFPTTTNTALANGWTYTKFSFSFSASPQLGAQITYGISTSTDATYVGNTFDIYDEQFEQNSFATPFTTSARTTTQAILDLTSSNTITANSLTYASDNTFSFNGSNYVQTGYTAALTDFSICVWFKASANTGGYDRIIDKLYTSGTMLMRNSNSANSWGGGVLEGSVPYGRFLTLTDGQWHYLVSVRQGTTHTLYGDGITNTISGTVSGTALNAFQFAVGSWYDNTGQRFNGYIPVVQIYNRALSATEILQNFNASRDRYGI